MMDGRNPTRWRIFCLNLDSRDLTSVSYFFHDSLVLRVGSMIHLMLYLSLHFLALHRALRYSLSLRFGGICGVWGAFNHSCRTGSSSRRAWAMADEQSRC
jgi:hypothetical protein